MNPSYFDPDPTIPDADLLGYGDLIFDDGTKRFLNGEPEIAGLVPRLPRNDPSMGPPPPPTADAYPMTPGTEGPPAAPNMAPYGQPAIGDTGSPPGVHVDPITGQVTPDTSLPPGKIIVGKVEPTASRLGMTGGGVQGGAQGSSSTGEPALDEQLKKLAPGSQELARAASQAAGLPTGVIVDQHGNVTRDGQGGGAAPASGFGSGGLVPYQREGALPQDIAQQRALELQTQQATSLDTLQMGRQQESQIYHDAITKRTAELDAEKAAREADLQEQQAKIARWQQEQAVTAKTPIEGNLVAARGGIGSMLMVVGAALLGKVGSDAGLRMIDSSIKQYVQEQQSRRDSQLHVLADQIGSAQQAAHALTGRLYQIVADKAEQMQALTKADAFEAQTPQIVDALRQRQLAERQKEQDTSLGKTIERAPAQAKGATPHQLEGYGKAAEGQAEVEQQALRALKAIGGHWDPKAGRIVNKDDVLKEGIPGVGNFDPLASAEPSGIRTGIMRAFAPKTTEQGLEVRASLEGLVAAEAKLQNPGRAPTDADRDAARVTLGIGTEQGAVNAIERVLKRGSDLRERNVAQFGPDAASQYEQTYRAVGGQGGATASPGGIEMAQPGSARQRLQQERAPKSSGNTAEDSLRRQGLMPSAPQAAAAPEPPATPEARMAAVSDALQTQASRELPPDALKILTAQAAHETGNGKSAPGNNMFGHKTSAGQRGAKYETTEGEGSGAKRVKAKFAAYDSIDQSVSDHLRLLQDHYPQAWRALQAGDVTSYVAALKDGGYFTDSETAYLNGLMRRM